MKTASGSLQPHKYSIYELARNGKEVSLERYETGLVGISTRLSEGIWLRNCDWRSRYSDAENASSAMGIAVFPT
jgi:hypothetical protein